MTRLSVGSCSTNRVPTLSVRWPGTHHTYSASWKFGWHCSRPRYGTTAPWWSWRFLPVPLPPHRWHNNSFLGQTVRTGVTVPLHAASRSLTSHVPAFFVLLHALVLQRRATTWPCRAVWPVVRCTGRKWVGLSHSVTGLRFQPRTYVLPPKNRLCRSVSVPTTQ